MVTDKIVRQFVAKGDPPVRHGFYQSFWAAHVPFVQLLEKAQVTEDAAILIESDGATLLVGEDVESGDGQVEDRGAVCEQNVEGSKRGLVFSEKDLRVRGVARKEEFHALTDIASECEVMAWLAVTVCW